MPPTGEASLTRAHGRHRATVSAGPSPLRRFWVAWMPLLLLALGTEMRLRQWLGGRSLWLDEALIARSLVSRDYLALVATPLQGDQAGPVLWLWSTRLSLDLFGLGERQLRLVALLAGLVSLVLTWRLARRLLPADAVPVAVAIAVLSPSLLYFSNEVKPYAVDVAAVLGLVLMALRVPVGERPGPALRRFALAGAVLVWASYAAIFALAGISVILVLAALPHGLNRALRVARPLTGWVVSLVASYVLVLHRLSNSEILSTYWAFSFPTGPADLPTWLLRRAVGLVEDPLELAVWPLALLLLAVGTIRLARRTPLPAALVGVAVPLATIAAALSVYPLASRLVLWLVPLAALALAAVLPDRLDRVGTLTTAAVALSIVVAPMAAVSLPQTVSVLDRNELRSVMTDLQAQRRPGDLILVDIPAKAPFDYYTPLTGLGRDGVILFASPEEVGGRCNDAAALVAGRFATQRVWVVFAHQLVDTARLGSREDTLARIGDVTSASTIIEAFGAKAVLFDPTAPRTTPSPEPRNPERCLAVIRTVPPTGAAPPPA